MIMRKNYSHRLAAGIFSAAAALSIQAFSASAAEVIYGDANCDGIITIADSTAVLQAISNSDKYALSPTGTDNADVFNRGDGITAQDAISIQKLDAKLITELPESWQEWEYPGDSETPAVTKTYIKLNGTTAEIEGEYATANGNIITITHSGEFYIEGTLNDGQINVNIPDETVDAETVKLFLNGANISGKSAPAIYIENAENTSINLVDGTENTISDGDTAYSGDWLEAAVIEAKDDITIKGGELGTGKLTLTAKTQDGIFCNNDLKITGGIIDISTLNTEAESDAVKGKSSLTIKGGEINVDAEGDALKSSKGDVLIEGGKISAKAGNDAVQAETTLTITDGTVIACGDRGLRGTTDVSITGGNILATATDYQCENLTSTQNAYLFDFVKEWEKNNPITLTDISDNVIFDTNTIKKFSYAVVSSADIKSGTDYKLFAGGISMLTETGENVFKADMPAAYKNVNNNDTSEVLYDELFSLNRVHKIEINMDETQWDDFITNAEKEEYYPCDITIDGELYENVGIRTKGNSSRLFVTQAGKDKYSFRIKLNEYDKFQNYHGLTEICMNNMYSDPSCMRDILCYDAMYEIGGYSPKCSYTDMYLNGQLYSFYFLAEQPGTTLAERLATNNDACLYKAAEINNNYDCTFTTTMSLDNFDLKFGDDTEKVHIKEVVDAINRVTPSDYKFIEDVIDVDSFLKGFAVNAVMCNYDSYNGMMAHNYYVMYNEGKMHYVGWDYNLSLGNFMDYGASAESDIKTGIYQADANQRPLIKNLLQIPEYYDKYIGFVKEITSMYSNPEQRVNEYAELIRSHVKADPRSFFTADQFETNISKSANGLQTGNGGNNGMWGGGFGGFGGWGGGFGFGGFGGGGGLFSYGGEQVSIVDFMVKRFEVIKNAIGQ